MPETILKRLSIEIWSGSGVLSTFDRGSVDPRVLGDVTEDVETFRERCV